MRKTKKQLLGLAGLAAVAFLTAVACTIPTPAAAAEKEPPVDNSNVTVQVLVVPDAPFAQTTSPLNESETVDGTPKVTTIYSEVETVYYKLYHYNTQTKEYEPVDLGEHAEHSFDYESDRGGTWEFELNLGENFGQYKLETYVDGYDGTKNLATDTIIFYYRALLANLDKGTEANGDPILTVEPNAAVDKVAVNVYDEDGNPLFVDKDGKEVTIWLNRSDIDPETGEIVTPLPFEKYGAKTGKYSIVVTGYNSSDAIVGMVVLPFNYVRKDPNAPETPNTGSLLSSLNISRADYLITGLLVFGLVIGFAMFLLFRKSRR